ncbi:DUF3833 family protein [Aliikangiella maris]|uniref:DUF3833 family protein n=2 Tax=Aliikangiella maris TaxID=3162458 RepID=A0ABV2BSH7_9GAMM
MSHYLLTVCFKKALLLAGSIFLMSCSSNYQDYATRQPAFNFTEFFDGQLCAWGLVRKRDDWVNRKFIASITAYRQNDTLILDEIFQFDDGEQQTRVWQFIQQGNQWIGRAGDVEGRATGIEIGDSLHLTYALNIPLDDSTLTIAMDDWLHRVDANTVMGSTQMTKWGFEVGSIDIVIQKQTPNVNYCKFTQR